MPTNLPPDYYEIEKRFREAESAEEKVALLEQMYSLVPKHKGTDHLRADMRRQLSKLKEESHARKKSGGHRSTYHLEKEGAGQVAVIGPTNVGKSALIAALTNAEPEVSEAPYTTWRPMPGMMPVGNIQVQLVDTPPLDHEYVEPGLFDLVRRADLTLLVIDLQADPLQQLEDSLAILENHHILPKQRQETYTGNQRMIFIPMLVLVNKVDDENLDEDLAVLCELFEGECPLQPISVLSERHFDALKNLVVEQLDVIRVYAKPPGKDPDLERPFVLNKGSTIVELAAKVHRDFYEKLKFARVWGSAEFPGQMVQRDYVLQDGDVVELRI